MATLQQVQAGILGIAVGDALGVPVEFSAREERRRDPVAGMRGYGTHHQPAGTWSDDTSLTLCTMESLLRGFNPADMMKTFTRWCDSAYLTAGDVRFDIGHTTHRAILCYQRSNNPRTCGQCGEMDAGNGSLMRILPMAYYLDARYDAPFTKNAEAMRQLGDVCALTHAHMRCIIACGMYCAIAQNLLRGDPITRAVDAGLIQAGAHYSAVNRNWQSEVEQLFPSSAAALSSLAEEQIIRSGYVVDSLFAALWCLCKTDSYAACVLTAVNLGGDTDTVAAIAGGLAGIAYGLDAIPKDWIAGLVRREQIFQLCADFSRACERKST